MRSEKKARLQKAGWKVGSAEDFLDLRPEEREFIDLKLQLSDALRKTRLDAHLTQADVARRLHSSQSRVAKMESADSSVTLDLLVRSLLVLGANRRLLGRVIGSKPRSRAA